MKKIGLLFAVFALMFADMAIAAEFRGGGSYSLSSGETINSNFYSSGGTLNISGTVNGDSFLAGGTINSLGRVSKDLFIAGGNISVSSEVGEDLRVAGGNISVGSRVNGETMLAGGQITIQDNSNLNRDVFVAGGVVVINGTINGNVNANGGRIEVRGKINGNLTADTADLQIMDTAVVSGTLAYRAPNEANIPQGAKIGNIQFTRVAERDRDKAAVGAVFGAFWFFKLISTLLIALLIYVLFRRKTSEIVLGTISSFWISVLIGFITLIILPIAMILVSITLIGIPLAALAFLIYILFLGLSFIGSGAVLGTWLFSVVKRNKDYRLTWVTIVAGTILLALLDFIPFVGWIVSFLFVLALFGRLFWNLFTGFRAAR